MKMKKIMIMAAFVLAAIFIHTATETVAVTVVTTEIKKEINMNIELLKVHEGFRGMPYKCSEGFDTIGYGTLLPLSEKEAEMLLRYRLGMVETSLQDNIDFYDDLPVEIRGVLLNLGYQLGITGLLKFRKTLVYLERREYLKASEEMKDSLWYKQTKNRAKELSKIVAACEGM
jgi:lysozyme